MHTAQVNRQQQHIEALADIICLYIYVAECSPIIFKKLVLYFQS
jgi:hypothetical protein